MQGIVYAVTFSVIFVLGICHMQNAIKSHQAVESLLEDGEKAAVWGTVSKKEEGAKSTKIYLNIVIFVWKRSSFHADKS